MRLLYPIATRLLVLSVICSVTAARGEESGEGPRLLDASITEGAKQVMPAAGAADGPALAPSSGDEQSTATPGSRASLSDRLQEIRRRAVDDDISRPFQVEVEKGARSTELRGALPEVPRKTIARDAARTAAAPRKTVGATEKNPTPATRPEGAPALTKTTKANDAATPVSEGAVAQPTELVATPAETNTPTTSQPGAPEHRVPVGISTSNGTNNQPAKLSAVPAPDAASIPAPANVTTTQPITRDAIKVEKENATSGDVLITNRAPSLSFETAGPKTIKVGQEATYRVTMINSGEVDARNLVVTVQLPAWTEVTGHTASVGGPHLESDASQNTLVRWHINELPTKGREHLQLNIIPRDSRPFDLSVGWTFAQGHSLAQIEVQEPKLEMSISGPEEVLYGETDTYTITLSNPGTGDAEGVVLQLMPLTPHQQTISARKFGTLKAGERKTVALELTAHQAGRLQVQAVALADGDLRVEAGQEVVVRRANLQVAAAGPVKTFAGTDGVYRIRVENTGDATAQESYAHVTLPAGAKYLASNDGGKFEAENGQVVWQIGSLRPGAVRVLEVRSTLTMPGENRFEIRAGGQGDLSASQMVTTHVEALADLTLFVNDPKGAIPVGADAVYEVKIVNRGTRAAERIQVVGYFSEGIEPHQVQGLRGEIGPGQVMFEPISVLAAGQELVFRITARAHQQGNHVFRAEVQCSSPETKLAAEEWTKYYGDAGVGAEMAAEESGESSATLTEQPANEGPTLNLR